MKANGDHTSDGSRERAVTSDIDELMTRGVWVFYMFLAATLALDISDKKHCKTT